MWQIIYSITLNLILLTGCLPATLPTQESLPMDRPYDVILIDTTIAHHLDTITLAKAVLAPSNLTSIGQVVPEETTIHQELQKLAQEWILARETDIQQLQIWRDQWYPNAGPSIAEAGGLIRVMVDIEETLPVEQRLLEAMKARTSAMLELAHSSESAALQKELRTYFSNFISENNTYLLQIEQWQDLWFEKRR